MPLVVTVFATAPGASAHSSSDVVASIGAGWSGVPPSGAGDALLWADGFEGPGSWSDEQLASVSAATASTVAKRRDCTSRSIQRAMNAAWSSNDDARVVSGREIELATSRDRFPRAASAECRVGAARD